MKRFKINTSIPSASLTFSTLLYFSRTQLPTCTVALMAADSRITNINFSLKKFKERDVESHLKNVLKMHIKLNETIKLINQCFLLRITLNALDMSFRWLIVLFGVCAIIIWKPTFNGIPFATVGVFFSLPDTTLLFLAVIYSCRLKNKMRQTEVLFKIRVLSLGNNLPAFKHLQKASLQFDHENSKISCGLFNFGWPALLSSVGTTLSFVIILIQFEIAGLT